MADDASNPSGPLTGVRVFDLSRILAGPTCTQILGDLGADVIKVERPGHGDDTRKWGPPFVKDAAGNDTSESAYYLSSNRNKRSLALDVSQPEGQSLAKRLIAQCDVLIQNYKVGGLARYGLGYDDLKDDFPALVYCSISGFGQTGPYAPRAGYDVLAQALGGIMSVTGPPEEPMKVGVGIADIMCGMYATIAILAALRERDATGAGQHLDIGLLDAQVAWLVNEGVNYLVSGVTPKRLGNEHVNVVPYKLLPASDGEFVLAAGNDGQFRRFCEFAGVPELADDPRFVSNSQRVVNRAALYALLPDITRRKTKQEWDDGLAARGVPSSPVNDIAQVFQHPQVQHRGSRITIPHPAAGDGEVPLLASPIKSSRPVVSYRRHPPMLGEHSDDVLRELLDLDDDDLAALRKDGVID
jgi:crotonobetainyl-CoA:carnitine CoA-transferase CaiB-like acyl-CoA transferase